jgi:tRNA (guanine26-N2/guanine27-N2)-dimethyltransferase
MSVGLLAVTCTDMAVLATTNYSEKWQVECVQPCVAVLTFDISYANYGGVPVKAEYCHEAVGVLQSTLSP